MQRKDYYDILGIARDADQSDIKKAYRKLAFQYHPDTNEGDQRAEDKFKEINEAYDVLGDRNKRSRYDLGEAPSAGPNPFQYSPFGSWADPFEQSFFSPFRCRGGGFRRAFGGRGRRFKRHPFSPGGHTPTGQFAHPAHDLQLTATEAQSGTERDLRLHLGGTTRTFTVSIPPGVKDGGLLKVDGPRAGARHVTLYFRVKIVG